jgi:hypothetical protein
MSGAAPLDATQRLEVLSRRERATLEAPIDSCKRTLAPTVIADDLATDVNASAHYNTRLDGTTNVSLFLPHLAMCMAHLETVSTVHSPTASFDAEQATSAPELTQPASSDVR